MIKTEFSVGPSKYSDGGLLYLTQYVQESFSSPALLVMRSGEPEYIATVNLKPYGSRDLESNEVWLKGWSENEGVPEALEAAGVLKRTGETMKSGFVYAELAILSDKVMSLLS